MRVLLAFTCLLVGVSAQSFTLTPGAKRGTFLNQIQTYMAEFYDGMFPNGKLANSMQLAILTAKNDLCKINGDADLQSQTSIIMGKTCKKAYVKLYNEEPDRCGGAFCNVVTNAESFLNETMRALIAAEFDKDFFNIIEEKVVDPAMEYSCKCMVKMLDAWLGCKHKIGDADIWYTLMSFGGFDTQAEYLGGKDWKNFWVDMIKDRLPWDDIKMFVGRTMANLCQRNTDARGEAQCYSYFYNTFTTLYQWYQKSAGMTPAIKKNNRNQGNTELAQCTTYDFSEFEEAEEVSFGDIKEAVVDKFCVEECAEMYQETFLGCCTASMIQDTDLEEAVTNTAEGIANIYGEVFPDEQEETNNAFKMVSDYFEDTMDMLRDPTCEDTDVTYDVTPCAGASGADECEGLSGKQLKICKRKQKSDKGDVADSDGGDECEGLSGKQLKICKRRSGGGGGGNKKGGKGKGGKGKGGKGKGGKKKGGRGRDQEV